MLVGTKNMDLEGLRELSLAIESLIELAGDCEDMDSEIVDKARINVRHHLTSVCISEDIHLEFIDSFLRNRGGI